MFALCSIEHWQCLWCYSIFQESCIRNAMSPHEILVFIASSSDQMTLAKLDVATHLKNAVFEIMFVCF